MSEYTTTIAYIREPNELLPEGSVVETHTHNHHHDTHLTMGLWEVHRFQPIHKDSGETDWLEMPLLLVRGGGPRSVVPIPANMRHKFVLLEGPGYYRCVFGHRDSDGRLSEAFTGYLDATY